MSKGLTQELAHDKRFSTALVFTVEGVVVLDGQLLHIDELLALNCEQKESLHSQVGHLRHHTEEQSGTVQCPTKRPNQSVQPL